MSRTERVVLYGLLVLALTALLNLGLGLGLGRGLAFDRAAEATAVAPEDPVLGPASALVLKGEKGELSLRNADGRIGWTKDAFGRAYSVGFVHITKPLRKLREQPKFADDADALTQELTSKDEEFRKMLEDASSKLRGIDKDSDEFKRLFADGEKMYKEYLAWQQTAMDRKNTLEAKQLEEAYRQLIDAVEVVSERLGVDIVYRFIATSEPFDAGDLGQALNEVRFRSVLRYPQGLDITPEVLKELGVEAD